MYAKMNNKAEIVVIQTNPDQFNRVVSTKIFKDMEKFKESADWVAFDQGPSKMINTKEEMEKMMKAHAEQKLKRSLESAESVPMTDDRSSTGYQA